jgi:hypothetical protein
MDVDDGGGGRCEHHEGEGEHGETGHVGDWWLLAE